MAIDFRDAFQYLELPQENLLGKAPTDMPMVNALTNLDDMDADQSRVLGERRGILDNINFSNLLSLAEIFSPTAIRRGLAGTKLAKTLINPFQTPTPNFQYRTPGFTGQLIASDQYDPITRTNRFDRATTLFGQSRNLMEYLQKKRDERARRASGSSGGFSSDIGAGFGGIGGRTGADDTSDSPSFTARERVSQASTREVHQDQDHEDQAVVLDQQGLHVG